MLPGPQILIVGAGPTGLVLALRLKQHGVAFRIIDRNSGPGLASRAMAVHARTLEFYRQSGITDKIIENGVKIEAVHVRENGLEVARLEFRDLGTGLSPYPFVLAYPQDDHERLLVDELAKRDIHVEWQTELASFSESNETVAVRLRKAS